MNRSLPNSISPVSVPSAILLALIFPLAALADFALLDDFESYPVENVRDFSSPWEAPNTGLFTILEEDGNQFLGYTWTGNNRAGSRPLPEDMKVAPGEEATLFLQFRPGPFTPGSDESAHFGFSHEVDVQSHAPVDDLRVEAAVRPGPSENRHYLTIRDGSEWRTVATVSQGVWHNLWFTIDRTGDDTFQAYLSVAGTNAGATEDLRLTYEENGTLISSFSFRDSGSATDVLDGFAAYGHSASNRSMHLDNLWIDNTGKNLSFVGDVFEGWVTAFEELDAPFTLDFGTGSGQENGEILLRSRSEDFLAEAESLRYAPASDSFASSAALAVVGNYLDRQDFTLETEMNLEQVGPAGEDVVGLAVLGGPHIPESAPFDVAGDENFYGLAWSPGEENGTSYLRIREGFHGQILAEEPWEGRAPFAGGSAVIFSEDFEDPQAAETQWSSGGFGDNWEIGEPESGPGSAVTGNNVAATGLSAPYSAGTDAWFHSPTIDLADVQDATLRFWEYTDVDDEAVEYHSTTLSILDAGNLQVIENGELSRDADQTGDWRLREFDLPAEALGMEIVLEFRLRSDSVAGDQHDGWFIDDIELTGTAASETGSFQIHAEGIYEPSGTLDLSFSLTDEDGFSQTLTAAINNPLSGNLFGIGGRSRATGSGDPAFDFGTLAMTTGDEPGPLDPLIAAPFNLAFGSGEGRSGDGNFVQNRPDEWSQLSEALRLEATGGTYRPSITSSRVADYSPGDRFLLETSMTLNNLNEGEAGNRAGLVLFGAQDQDVFDAEDDTTYYTFQWIPAGDAAGQIALREGMDGDIIAQADFGDAVTGAAYTFRFLGAPNGTGGLEFFALLSDGMGETATLSGEMTAIPDGNRFGVGAWHRAAENPVWDFHDLHWLDAPMSLMHLDVPFGIAAGRAGDGGFLKSGHAPDAWSLEEESLRHSRSAGPLEELSFENAAAVVNVVDYVAGQDFVVRSTLTPTGIDILDETVEPVFLDFPNQEDYVTLGTNGMDVDSGTIELFTYIVNFDGAWIYAQHAPEDAWNNRLQIKRGEIGFGNDSEAMELAGTPTGEWMRLSLTYDESFVRYYINGELQGEISRPAGFEAWADNAYLMNAGPVGNNDRGPDGKVIDVRHWNHARTEAEIQSDMHQRLSGQETGLVGYWPLTEGEGGTVLDRSGNGNDGTIVGAQWRTIPRFGLTLFGETPAGVLPGSNDFSNTSARFEWLPFIGDEGGELRLNLPGEGNVASTALAGAASAPVFAEDTVYTLEVQGIHDASGNLELTGTLSSENGGEATLVHTLASAAGTSRGNWFGVTGNNAQIDWHTFAIGTPEQMGDGPGEPDDISFDEWRAEVFNDQQLADEDISGAAADPAGDGFSNLLKFAFGLHPFTAATFSEVIEKEVVNGRLQLTYLERIGASDIEYIPEVSIDLHEWNGGSEYIEEVDVSLVDGGEFYRITVRAVAGENDSKEFLRVRVNQQ